MALRLLELSSMPFNEKHIFLITEHPSYVRTKWTEMKPTIDYQAPGWYFCDEGFELIGPYLTWYDAYMGYLKYHVPR